MDLEGLRGNLRKRPTLATLGAAATDQRLEEAGKLTEVAALEEEKERNERLLKRWESIAQMAERVPEFLSMIDECVKNYYVAHREDHPKNRGKYDDLVTQIRNAVEDFLTNIVDKEFLKVLEINLTTISDLCKKIYKLDNTFPDLALLDEEKFLKAARAEVGEEDPLKSYKLNREFKSHHLGQFHVCGYPEEDTVEGWYSILDQQAHRMFGKRFSNIREIKGNNAIVTVGYSKHYLFMGEQGKLSQEFESLRPLVGELYVGIEKGKQTAVVIDKNARVLHKISSYVPNAEKTRAVVQIGFGYNVMLADGSLLFEDSAGFSVREVTSYTIHSSWSVGGKISSDIILEPRGENGKFRRLNKKLEVIAEGSSEEEVRKDQKKIDAAEAA